MNSWLGRWGRDVVLAVVVGSALSFALSHVGLGALDTLVWRTLSAAVDEQSVGTNPNNRGDRTALALLVSENYFLNGFKERTPLDRNELANLIDAVATPLHAAAGNVVVIDFDISPFGERSPGDFSQSTLEDAVLRMSDKARVILLCPLAVESNRRNIRQAWAQNFKERADKRLAGEPALGRGIEFGSAKVQIRFGAALTFAVDDLSVGARARKNLLAMHEGRTPDEVPPCADQDTKTGKHNWWQEESGKRILASAVNRVLDHGIDNAIQARQLVATEVKLPGHQLILIGGGYEGHGDFFDVASRKDVPGTVVHGAIAVTDKYYPTAMDVALPFLLASAIKILGVIWVFFLGYLLERLLTRFMKIPSKSSPTMSQHKLNLYGWLWGSHADHDGRTHADIWLQGLMATFAVIFLLFSALATFGSVLFLTGEWVDFVTPAIAAWLKVVAGFIGSIVGQPVLIADRHQTRRANRVVWIRLAVFVRLGVLLVGIGYPLWTLRFLIGH